MTYAVPPPIVQAVTFFLWFLAYQGSGLVGSAFTRRAIGRRYRYGCGKRVEKVRESDATAPPPQPGDRDYWYYTLPAPWFMPPGWLFGVAWFLLYSLDTAAIFCVLRLQLVEGLATDPVFLSIVGLNFGALVLSLLWAPVFYGAQSPFGGFLVTLLHMMLSVVLAVLYWLLYDRLRTPPEALWAAILYLPQVLWLLFAAVLNGVIAQMASKKRSS